MKSEFDFVVLGAGAIGSILAAHLARADHSVAVIARGHRAAYIQKSGLQISGLAEFTVPVQVLTDPLQLERCAVLIVATKAIGTAGTLAPLRHVRVETALSIQNGTLKDDLLASAFGKACVLGSLADVSGELLDSGQVLFTRNVNLLLGEISGDMSERARSIAAAIDGAGVRATAVDNIVSLEWSKLVAWAALLLVAVTTRSVTWKYLCDANAAEMMVRIVREVSQLTSALNIELTDQAVLPVATLCQGAEADAVQRLINVGQQFAAYAPGHKMSGLQDLEAGRSLELAETLGETLNRAERLGLQLPLVSVMYRLAETIDRLRRMP